MNTLRLLMPVVEKHSIRFPYSLNGETFQRGLDFDDMTNVSAHIDDPVFQRLVAYSAIADAIYTFGLEYFDNIKLPYQLTDQEKVFFEKTYLHGLAEFRYTNNMDIHRLVCFTWDDDAPLLSRKSNDDWDVNASTALVLNGGGKDGAVAVEMSKKMNLDVTWFTAGGAPSKQRIVEASEVPHAIYVKRFTDGYVGAHSIRKGHKPMSFYVAMVAVMTAYMTGRRYVIAANEYSASFPNLEVDSFAINHQYSKSSDFERELQQFFVANAIPVEYFSITRPLYELQILKIFSSFDQYHDQFLSCNNGMRDDNWCLDCPKCAFVVGAMYIYSEKSARRLWGEPRDVYAGNNFVDQLIELLNPSAKPLECIGTIEENVYLVRQMMDRNFISFTLDQIRLVEMYLGGAETNEPVDLNSVDRSDNFPDSCASQIREVIKMLHEDSIPTHLY